MSKFTLVKKDIAKIKTDVHNLAQKLQLTYNNIVDMPGLADQVNILAASHATLFTLLHDIHDAKKKERERRKKKYKIY